MSFASGLTHPRREILSRNEHNCAACDASADGNALFDRLSFAPKTWDDLPMTPDLRTPDGHPISPFCFGTMQWGGKADPADSRAMYEAVRAAGMNFFDTAHGYTGGA